MSNIHIGSGRRRGTSGGSVRKRTNYASFGLFVAAAAIAVSAAVIRVRKDRVPLADETAAPSASSAQTSVTADGTQTAATTAYNAPRDTAASQKNETVKTDPQPPSLPANADELEDSEQTLAIQVMGQNITYVRPVGGAVTKPYSMSSLVYSRTMGDWRVHTGLDLSANEGEPVKAAAEGTVAGISEDPLYGVTVVINQNDGLMVYYRGLSKDTAVRQGENIAAGATIGTVGAIPCENGDGSHLHIEVVRENKFLDPATLLGIK